MLLRREALRTGQRVMATEFIYGRCERCGGPLIAGHECKNVTSEIAKLVVETAKGNYLGSPACFKLELACKHLRRAFGEYGAYQVGSSLRRGDWRDVDVRYILPDEEFAKLFPDAGTSWELDERWLLLTVAISGWLSEQSGLPVDFQFQPQTHANEVHKGNRNAVGMYLSRRRAAESESDVP